MRPSDLAEMLRANDVAFIHEPVENSRWWMLRSLPALRRLDIEHFTFPTSWRQLGGRGAQYDYLDYEYHVIGDIEPPAGANLCVITNEHYETETAHSIDHLINRFTAREGTLLVVADTMSFTPAGGQRPLYQEQFTNRIGTTNLLFEAFTEQYRAHDWTLPLTDTKNMFIQDNAKLYELVTGERLTESRALFDILPEAPYLPLYNVFSQIFARPDEYGSVPLGSDDDVSALGRWLRRRIEWDRETGINVARQLNRAVAADGSTFDPSYARRSPAMQEARAAASDLEPTADSIEARYHEQLTTEAQ